MDSDSESVEVLDESIINLCIHLRLPGHRAQHLSTDLVGSKRASVDAPYIIGQHAVHSTTMQRQ